MGNARRIAGLIVEATSLCDKCRRSAPLGGTCPTCGADNDIVNQCGCDPDNMPTKPLSDKPVHLSRNRGGLPDHLTPGWISACGEEGPMEKDISLVTCRNCLDQRSDDEGRYEEDAAHFRRLKNQQRWDHDRRRQRGNNP